MEPHYSNHHENHGANTFESEIIVFISYQNKVLSIQLKDQDGKAPELGVTHEKYMHFILVSNDLNEYYHLHPIQKDEGTYEQEIELTGNSYKAFVDISPIGKNYSIKPVPLQIGDVSHADLRHSETVLKIDEQLTKKIKGKIVEFQYTPLEAGKVVRFTFVIKNATPEPYLGALGHVVIIDEKGKNFIHVHPISDKDTVFDAHFDEPGLYKIWAEFKFNGEVLVFPYVIEVR